MPDMQTEDTVCPEGHSVVLIGWNIATERDDDLKQYLIERGNRGVGNIRFLKHWLFHFDELDWKKFCVPLRCLHGNQWIIHTLNFGNYEFSCEPTTNATM